MKKSSLILIAISAVIIVLALVFYIDEVEIDIDSLYEEAIIDAMYAQESEIYDLVKIDTNEELTTWNENCDMVLLVTWNKYPDSYVEGTEVTLSYGAVWTFTDKEIMEWYAENEDSMDDYQLRLNQLIGLPENDDNTHFTAFWVYPEDIIRPAYSTDVQSDITELTMVDMDSEYQIWFENNIIDSYYSEYLYSWTRLGYTYDWADNGEEYGLTEFLVLENSVVTVEYTMTTEEFIEYLISVQ